MKSTTSIPGRVVRPHMWACAALAATCSAAPPALEGILIREDLSETPVSVRGLDAAGLHMRKGAQAQVLGFGDWLAFVAAGADAPVGPRQESFATLLVLTDGQRTWGRLASPEQPETLTWELPTGERLLVPLEHVAAISFTGDLPALKPGPRDVITTTSGDRLEGFVASIGPTAEIEVGSGTISLLAIQCSNMSLANPAVPPSGALLHLADGSALAAATFGPMQGARATFTSLLPGREPDSPSSSVVLGEIRSVIADAARLVPLAAQPPTSVAPGPGRRWAPPPMIDAQAHGGLGRIEISGPMQIEWSLPEGARAFAASFELPDPSRLWGECEIVISGVDSAGNASVLARSSFRGDSPGARLVADLGAASTLRIELLDGASGPIQDRIVMHRPVLRID